MGPISQTLVMAPNFAQSIARMFQPWAASNLMPTDRRVGLSKTQRKKSCGLAGPASLAPSPIQTYGIRQLPRAV
jgi:hypothetical protein